MPDPAPTPRSKRGSPLVELGLVAPNLGEDSSAPTIQSGGGGVGGDGGSSMRRRAIIASMPEPGRRLGTFLIREPIGVGGMGAVFLAQDTALDRPVALKILPPEQSSDSEVVQRFYQEARAAARLDHENIARVYTIGGDETHHYIAFEYIEGTTVRARVEQSGPLPVSEAINFTLQIAGALVHASERGVVHRDVKPSNIIVTPQDRVKLVDMGLARRFERKGDDGLTQSGMTLGTFDYISPEQARDPRDVDVRSDLYSLGCTLFHMLTGRPPFPAGTVLQKLLQHQEEPAPDVRTVNPSVPADLAAILLKLMAKDRDRRYQTPEQLVRDLLSVAGSLGLRSVSPEGLVWLGSNPPRAWERHLVWGVPTLALAMIVMGLIWWGQPVESVSNGLPFADRPGATGPAIVPKTGDIPSLKGSVSGSTTGLAKDLEQAPKFLNVKAGDDLAAILASAPTGSTVTIVESATFPISSPLRPQGEPRFDVVLRALPGLAPILKSSGLNGGPLLRFGPGRVVLDGLEFRVGDAEGETMTSAILSEGADLTIRRCSFRRDPAHAVEGKAAALRISASTLRSTHDDRPPPVIVERSVFGPGLIALLAEAPVDSHWRDCSIGSTTTAFSIENPSATAGVTRVTLKHLSLIAGDRPIFRIEGSQAIIRVDDSVLAAPPEIDATLVSIDDPSRLDWFGRGNLYGRIAAYLVPDPGNLGRTEVRSFDAWADGEESAREEESLSAIANVWKSRDPLSLFESQEPASAFVIAAASRSRTDLGARIQPDEPSAGSGTLITSAESARSRSDRLARNATSRSKASTAQPSQPIAIEPKVDSRASPMPMSREDGNPGAADPPGAITETKPPGASLGADLAKKADPIAAGLKEPAAIRTADELREAFKSTGTRSRRIVIAFDAMIDLPGLAIPGTGRWSLIAEAGPSRPRIQFRPDPTESRVPGSVASLFQLRAGSLEVRGLDIMLASGDAPKGCRWSAFELGAGADLGLNQCTVTVEGDDPRSAAVVIANEDDVDLGIVADSSAASIRIVESLLRVGGDVIDVGAGRRLDLVASDSDFASGGSLVHGHGLPKGEPTEPLKLTLRQVAARLSGGLALIQGAADEPELPSLGVLIRDSLLATTDRGDPLIVLEGQGKVDELRDRVEWEGHAVAYHRIDVYRRDQSTQTGAVPERFDRQAWARAVGTKETDAIHADLRFLKPWKPGRSPWTAIPDDFLLATDSPSPSVGPNLKIPSPARSERAINDVLDPIP